MATSDPEAYRQFSHGMQAYQGVRFADAAESFRRALTVDPTFASAQLRLGMSLLLEGQAKDGMTWIRKAIGEPGRLSERERTLAEGILASLSATKGDPSWKFEFQQLSQRYPKDQEGSFWYSEALAAREGDRFEAIRLLREAVERDPNDALAISALTRHLEELGLKDDAMIILRDFQKRNPAPVGGPNAPRVPIPTPPPPHRERPRNR